MAPFYVDTIAGYQRCENGGAVNGLGCGAWVGLSGSHGGGDFEDERQSNAFPICDFAAFFFSSTKRIAGDQDPLPKHWHKCIRSQAGVLAWLST